MQSVLKVMLAVALCVGCAVQGFVAGYLVHDYVAPACKCKGGCPCGEVACGGCKCGDHCECCKDCRRWCGDKNCPQKP